MRNNQQHYFNTPQPIPSIKPLTNAILCQDNCLVDKYNIPRTKNKQRLSMTVTAKFQQTKIFLETKLFWKQIYK